MLNIALTSFAGFAIALAGAAPRPSEYFPAPGPAERPFSEAVRVGDVLYLSGQIGIRADGTLPDTFEAQAKQMMDNIGNTLARRKLGWGDVFHCLVLLDDMADWPAFNKIYVPYFTRGRLPARSALGADGLAMNAKVEMECQAHMGAR